MRAAWPEWLVLVGVALAASSGMLGILFRALSERVFTFFMVLAAAVGLTGAALALARPSEGISLTWAVPGGALQVQVDALSAMFVLQIFLIGVLLVSLRSPGTIRAAVCPRGRPSR